MLIRIVAPRYWVTMLAVGALLVAAATWGVFGRIETSVPGSGAILASAPGEPASAQWTPQVVGVVAAQSANAVQPGDVVRVVPVGTNTAGLQTLPGTVVAISALPVTAEQLADQVGSAALADQLIADGGGTVKSVTVAFDQVDQGPQGPGVIDSHGTATPVRFGMQASVQVVTSSEAPIETVLR